MFEQTKAFSGFSVNDLEVARQFYSHTLGLQVTEEPNMGFWLQLATGGRVFVYPKPNHVPASFTVLNFPVENIDTAVADLQTKGVTIIHYNNPNLPQDKQGILRGRAVNMGPDIAWFADPSGNILSVLQD